MRFAGDADLVGREARVAAGDALATVLLTFRVAYSEQTKTEECEQGAPHSNTSG